VTIHPIDVIQHKRDGLVLSDAEIQGFIHALVHRTPENPTPTDAQAAAFLMAVFLRGLNPQELAALTQAMRFSGEVLDSSPLDSFVVDKHSTGGVGDKTSLLIAPIVAAAGLKDPMISGRSLGHTGGRWTNWRPSPDFARSFRCQSFFRSPSSAVLRWRGRHLRWCRPTAFCTRCATTRGQLSRRT